jgi:hypothetical protein
MDCSRRVVLKMRVSSSSQAPAALLGSLKHELFEQLVGRGATLANDCLSQEEVFEATLLLQADAADIIKKITSVPSAVLAVEACGLSLKSVEQALTKSVPSITDFMGAHVFRRHQATAFRISTLVSTEDALHCAALGLRGVLDMVADIQLGGTALCNQLVVVELKTGHLQRTMNPAHRAQVALYSVMLACQAAAANNSEHLDLSLAHFCAESFGCRKACGLLLHLLPASGAEQSSFQVDAIPFSWQEVRSLFILRNTIAHKCLSNTLDHAPLGIPRVSVPNSVCERCFDKDICGLAQLVENTPRALVGGKPATHPPSRAAYVQHWWNLLQLEQKETERRFLSKPASSAARQRISAHPFVEAPFAQVHVRSCSRTLLSIKNGEQFSVVAEAIDKQSLPLRAGDTLILSLATGPCTNTVRTTVRNVDARTICLQFRKDPRASVAPHLLRMIQNSSSQKECVSPTIWDLRRETFSSSMRLCNTALLRLSKPVHETLYGILSGALKPSFSLRSQHNFNGISAGSIQLNSEQQAAVQLCLSADHLAIIQGMPGAGKSTMTVLTCVALLQQGKRILLCSYTNSAVDGLLTKLAQVPGFSQYCGLRIGTLEKMQKSVQCMTVGQPMAACSVADSQWVAGTVHSLFNIHEHKGVFDVAIVDEASQLTEPLTVAVAQLAKVLILVGDHQQIAPLVQSDTARTGGLGISLMQRLASLWPHTLVKLCTQFRMNLAIQSLSNGFMYNGQMQCGRCDDKASFNFRQATQPEDAARSCSWAASLLNDSLPVLFVDVQKSAAACGIDQASSLHECPTGAACIIRAYLLLRSSGHKSQEIAIVCVLRKHVTFFQRVLAHDSPLVGTVDTFQGAEAPTVLLDAFEMAGQQRLLLDACRLNVALTRAKDKLVVFCHVYELWRSPLRVLQSQIEQCGWIHNHKAAQGEATASIETICQTVEQGCIPNSYAWQQFKRTSSSVD